MFKCLDCEKTYKEKPDYCECGNNTFEEIGVVSKVEKSQQERKTFSQQYPQIQRFVSTLDPISLFIFISCIFLSVLALIFIQPAQKLDEKTQKVSKPINKTIPSIESLWVNASENKQENQVEKKVQPVQIIKKEQTTKPKPQEVKKENKVEVKKQEEKKVVVKENNTKIVAQEQIKTVKNNETKKLEDVNEKQNAKQWDSYKVSLRQALFNNLAVTSIVGSGDCIIEFAIAKDGKIVERAFTQQSPNESVNKAVYNMMMKMPYYYVPPIAYNGQKIKLHFSFNNGNYSISYVD